MASYILSGGSNNDLETDRHDYPPPHDLVQAFSTVTLPCGRTMQNRFVKAAMYEHAASFLGGPPNAVHHALYTHWGAGAWGMVITGNVQVSATHLTLGCDTVVPPAITPASLAPFRALAAAIHGRSTHAKGGQDTGGARRALAVMQLSHAGRQAATIVGGRAPFDPPLAPSATRVGAAARDGVLSRVAFRLMFQTARAMRAEEVEEVVAGFVRGARVAYESGFDGVQLHASHGYLLAQFLSPKTNLRTDEYGEPLRLVRRLVSEIRAIVPRDFVVGIKLNAADYVAGGLTEDQALEHVREIATWEMDFIEVSGGDYESPIFMKATSTRQAFFESFSRRAVAALPVGPGAPLVMLTGGLRTRAQFASVLEREHAHLLGLGRLAVLHPRLPAELRARDANFLTEAAPEPGPATPGWVPSIVGASAGIAWYSVAMRRLAEGRGAPYGVGAVGVLVEMYIGRWYLWILWTCVTVVVAYAVA